ncbi:MAG: HAD hydrolase family protein [Clostridia bacterium]|nr:HAD hydrolase family protein [Clostridia bacterium]
MPQIKLIAMDLDGTLTQHKTPLSEEHREILSKLSKKYKLLMAGAGMCRRIFEQMGRFPIDILGNYGMQYAEYNPETKDIEIIFNEVRDVDRESVERRVTMLREKYGFTEFRGDNVEYHASGCITFPVLGTKALQEDKLAFDPDRKKRRAIYEDVKSVFSDYTVFVGGSSSFDMAPFPFDKAYALGKYCDERGIKHSEVVYIGDDYGEGGNDESVYKADFNYLKIDDYRDFAKVVKELL